MQTTSPPVFVQRPRTYTRPVDRVLKPATLQIASPPVSVERPRTYHRPEDRAPAPVTLEHPSSPLQVFPRPQVTSSIYGNLPMVWDRLHDPAPKTLSDAQIMVSTKLKPLCTKWFTMRKNEGRVDTLLWKVNKHDFKENVPGGMSHDQFVQEVNRHLIELRNDQKLNILNQMEGILQQIRQYWLLNASELDISAEEKIFFESQHEQELFDKLFRNVNNFLKYRPSQHSNEWRKSFIIMSKMLQAFLLSKKSFMDDQSSMQILLSTAEGQRLLQASKEIEKKQQDMRVDDSTQPPFYYVALHV